jgi:hypothetical protein
LFETLGAVFFEPLRTMVFSKNDTRALWLCVPFEKVPVETLTWVALFAAREK